MKKILLLITALTFAAPAGAKVFIYNWTCKEVNYKYYTNQMYLWKVSDRGKGYLVIDTNDASADANFIEFKTVRVNGKREKESWKWPINFRSFTTTLDNKPAIILSAGAGGVGSRMILTGEIKNGIVKKFIGSEVFNENYGNNYLGAGTAKWTFSFNKKWSAIAEGSGFDITETVKFVSDKVEEMGYVWQ